MTDPGPVAKEGPKALSTLKQRLGVIHHGGKVIRNRGKFPPLNGTKLIQMLLY
jgi:hypothetical protein